MPLLPQPWSPLMEMRGQEPRAGLSLPPVLWGRCPLPMEDRPHPGHTQPSLGCSSEASLGSESPAVAPPRGPSPAVSPAPCFSTKRVRPHVSTVPRAGSRRTRTSVSLPPMAYGVGPQKTGLSVSLCLYLCLSPKSFLCQLSLCPHSWRGRHALALSFSIHDLGLLIQVNCVISRS